jgi:hypothetical protein
MIIYEDNVDSVTQMQTCYIKSNITKHIAPKLFHPHELQQSGELNILQTISYNNIADLFTRHGISMQQLASFTGETLNILTCIKHYIALFSYYEFFYKMLLQ